MNLILYIGSIFVLCLEVQSIPLHHVHVGGSADKPTYIQIDEIASPNQSDEEMSATASAAEDKYIGNLNQDTLHCDDDDETNENSKKCVKIKNAFANHDQLPNDVENVDRSEVELTDEHGYKLAKSDFFKISAILDIEPKGNLPGFEGSLKLNAKKIISGGETKLFTYGTLQLFVKFGLSLGLGSISFNIGAMGVIEMLSEGFINDISGDATPNDGDATPTKAEHIITTVINQIKSIMCKPVGAKYQQKMIEVHEAIYTSGTTPESLAQTLHNQNEIFKQFLRDACDEKDGNGKKCSDRRDYTLSSTDWGRQFVEHFVATYMPIYSTPISEIYEKAQRHLLSEPDKSSKVMKEYQKLFKEKEKQVTECISEASTIHQTIRQLDLNVEFSKKHNPLVVEAQKKFNDKRNLPQQLLKVETKCEKLKKEKEQLVKDSQNPVLRRKLALEQAESGLFSSKFKCDATLSRGKKDPFQVALCTMLKDCCIFGSPGQCERSNEISMILNFEASLRKAWAFIMPDQVSDEDFVEEFTETQQEVESSASITDAVSFNWLMQLAKSSADFENIFHILAQQEAASNSLQVQRLTIFGVIGLGISAGSSQHLKIDAKVYAGAKFVWKPELNPDKTLKIDETTHKAVMEYQSDLTQPCLITSLEITLGAIQLLDYYIVAVKKPGVNFNFFVAKHVITARFPMPISADDLANPAGALQLISALMLSNPVLMNTIYDMVKENHASVESGSTTDAHHGVVSSLKKIGNALLVSLKSAAKSSVLLTYNVLMHEAFKKSLACTPAHHTCPVATIGFEISMDAFENIHNINNGILTMDKTTSFRVLLGKITNIRIANDAFKVQIQNEQGVGANKYEKTPYPES